MEEKVPSRTFTFGQPASIVRLEKIGVTCNMTSSSINSMATCSRIGDPNSQEIITGGT